MDVIKRIDIANFGSFKGFEWKTNVRNEDNEIEDFKKLNILYGRNYSGKTTLSRVFRTLETGILPQKFANPHFEFITDDGKVNHNQISNQNVDIRVYNKDFINEHLSFLADDEGKITPIAIIGDDNTNIEKEINDKRQELGSVDEKNGLYHQYELKKLECSDHQSKLDTSKRNFEKKLTNKANKKPNGIKHQAKFSVPTYNINTLNKDITHILNASDVLLQDDEKTKLEKLLQYEKLPEITINLSYVLSFVDDYNDVKALIEKKIIASKPIQELLDDHLLQEWVKKGQQHHIDKRENCGFCGNPLPSDLWQKLDEHFNKESEDLLVNLTNKLSQISLTLNGIGYDFPVEATSFYSEFHSEYADLKKLLKQEIIKYKNNLKKLQSFINKRSGNIFTIVVLPEIQDNSKSIIDIVEFFNNLITKTNLKANTLEDEQVTAREKLRLSEVAVFIDEISYVKDLEGFTKTEKYQQTLNDKKSNIFTSIKSIESEIEVLDAKIKDEKKGADQVNKYLNHFFGHDSLQLEAIQEQGNKSFKFQIKRGNELAHNLSEGECSLVAFCYFIAKLDDIESSGKKLIVYIDDPISSLDNNHIFFIYSLIENVLARPVGKDGNNKNIYKYNQMFISTHNLDFLKYIKRLSKPRKQCQHFTITGKKSGSELSLMASYMKNYVTEFNYLFNEIYICSDEANSAMNHNSFYNFGNNLRKFLESFLFFKYPFSVNTQEDHNQRIEKFFGGDEGADALVQRLINEFSHLAEMFDRSVQPIDHAEISKLAKFVLLKLKENDEQQYQCLIESVS